MNVWRVSEVTSVALTFPSLTAWAPPSPKGRGVFPLPLGEGGSREAAEG